MAHQRERVLLPLSFPARFCIVPVPRPALSLLCSSELLKESSVCLVHLALLLSKLCGKGSPETTRLALPWLSCQGLNTSTHLPLWPHFWILPQSVTPASLPVFFQPFWAAIVNPGRYGPVAWSKPSPSSQAGAVTWGAASQFHHGSKSFPSPWLKACPQVLNISMKLVSCYKYVK